MVYDDYDDVCHFCALSAWIRFSSPSVCLSVRSITQKRMISQYSNLVHGMTSGYLRSDTVLGLKGQRSRLRLGYNNAEWVRIPRVPSSSEDATFSI